MDDDTVDLELYVYATNAANEMKQARALCRNDPRLEAVDGLFDQVEEILQLAIDSLGA